MGRDFLLVHASWSSILEPLTGDIEKILQRIEDDSVTPDRNLIFKALEIDVEDVRIVIFGQDPYPAHGSAMGLAFSVPSSVTKIPASLRNIFAELQSDVGVPTPTQGDLSPWSKKGVLLLNRILTTRIGETGAHSHIGWQKITDAIAQELGRRGVIAILWGKNAQELAPFFTHVILSPHPSPLSAHRGFLGSRPFSRANSMLENLGKPGIDWSL